MIGYVEDGRLVKLEGHPDSIRTEGVMCARGQAGVNQVYFPDRILYPLKRAGKRGEHKWKRISWDEALDTITAKIKPLRDAGTPELFMYHYGRHKASQAATMYDFMGAFGTKTVADHTSVCDAPKHPQRRNGRQGYQFFHRPLRVLPFVAGHYQGTRPSQ